MTRLCRTWFRDADRFAIDCAHDTLPAGEGFFEADFDCCNQVVVLALEVGVFFL